MRLLTEKIENSQAIFQMEVEAEELDVSMEEAYRRLLPGISIPGFRKGKAPRSLVEQQVGKRTFLEEALAQLIPNALDEMLKSRCLEAVAEPEIKLIQTNPVTVEAVVPLYPTVKLGDYKGIRLEPEPVEFGDDNVEAVMNQAREQQGTRVPVNISEIKEKKLPELNDEFARSLGHESLNSMREHVRAQLKVRAEELSRRRFERKVIEAVAQLCEVNYPPVLVDREIDRLLNEEASNFKDGVKGLEAYLKNISKTLAEHKKEELRPIAIRRLVEALVLEKIAEEEKLQVSAAEIDEEIDKLTKEAGSQGEELQKVLALPQVRHSIEHSLLSRKTIDKLVEIAEGKV